MGTEPVNQCFGLARQEQVHTAPIVKRAHTSWNGHSFRKIVFVSWQCFLGDPPERNCVTFILMWWTLTINKRCITAHNSDQSLPSHSGPWAVYQGSRHVVEEVAHLEQPERKMRPWPLQGCIPYDPIYPTLLHFLSKLPPHGYVAGTGDQVFSLKHFKGHVRSKSLTKGSALCCSAWQLRIKCGPGHLDHS